jgi:hypothetical protein
MLRGFAKGIAVLGFVFSTAASADFLPPNNLHLQKKSKNARSNVSKEQFELAIAKATDLYKDVVESHDGQLSIVNNWDDETVNASASQFFGFWVVNMYGGLARRPEVTPDGFVLVLCHELGHHLGGYTFVSSWGANEGQADYFATHSCAKEFWGSEEEINATFRESIAAAPKAICDGVYTTEKEQNLCYRTLTASKSLADLLAALHEVTVEFETPDESTVEATNHSHPAAQCRLDTYAAGAVCTQNFDKGIIPGKGESAGQNNRDAELESEKYTCTLHAQNTTGVRPSCWFKPLIALDE